MRTPQQRPARRRHPVTPAHAAHRWLIATCACLGLLSGCASAQAAGEDEDWRMIGRVLSLVHTVTQAAASEDPQAAGRAMERILSGADPVANRLAGELVDEAFADMPREVRGSALAVARDMAALARREAARASQAPAQPALGQGPGASGPGVLQTEAAVALQARRDLQSMGLTYHDAGQFLEAVRRNDLLAVELYVAGRGVNLDVRDGQGRSALEIARTAGNARLGQVLAAAR